MDLKKPAARDVLADLVRVADIVVDNVLPRTQRKLGISEAWARKINKGVIWAALSTYGRTGPDSERPGMDLVAQAGAD